MDRHTPSHMAMAFHITCYTSTFEIEMLRIEPWDVCSTPELWALRIFRNECWQCNFSHRWAVLCHTIPDFPAICPTSFVLESLVTTSNSMTLAFLLIGGGGGFPPCRYNIVQLHTNTPCCFSPLFCQLPFLFGQFYPSGRANKPRFEGRLLFFSFPRLHH